MKRALFIFAAALCAAFFARAVVIPRAGAIESFVMNGAKVERAAGGAYTLSLTNGVYNLRCYEADEETFFAGITFAKEAFEKQPLRCAVTLYHPFTLDAAEEYEYAKGDAAFETNAEGAIVCSFEALGEFDSFAVTVTLLP